MWSVKSTLLLNWKALSLNNNYIQGYFREWKERVPLQSATLLLILKENYQIFTEGLKIPSPVPRTLFRKDGLSDLILKYSLWLVSYWVCLKPAKLSSSTLPNGKKDGGGGAGVNKKIYYSLWKNPRGWGKNG